LKKISYFAFVGSGCPDRLFWGKFLNQKWTSIKATEIIGSYLHEPVQGRAQSKCSSFAEKISTSLRGPHDSSGVAISRQE
jgi:hypothetical protein